MIKPIAVFPMYDPTGAMFKHLISIVPDLKALFGGVFISVPPETYRMQPGIIDDIRADPFFTTLLHPKACSAGEDFFQLYHLVSEAVPADQVLHLCFIDRLAYGLKSEHRDAYLADMAWLRNGDMQMPVLFQRSEKAWETHPRNYRVLENMVTDTGALLFGRRLDYAWCYLVMRAAHLQMVLPQIRHPGISMVAEVLLPLREIVLSRDVDWLAWEDPYIAGVDALRLKQSREESTTEVVKRLGYVVPMLELLKAAAHRDQR